MKYLPKTVPGHSTENSEEPKHYRKFFRASEIYYNAAVNMGSQIRKRRAAPKLDAWNRSRPWPLKESHPVASCRAIYFICASSSNRLAQFARIRAPFVFYPTLSRLITPKTYGGRGGKLQIPSTDSESPPALCLEFEISLDAWMLERGAFHRRRERILQYAENRYHFGTSEIL